MLFVKRRLKRMQPASTEPNFAAKVSSVFDGRKHGPIRTGATNNAAASLWIFAEHVEYVAGLGSVKRLDLADIEAVTTRQQLFGGRLVFQRKAKNSIVEFGFGWRESLQEALSVMNANGFPLTDRAISVLHS